MTSVKIRFGDADLREDLEIRLPGDDGAGAAAGVFFLLQFPVRFALAEVHTVMRAAGEDLHLHEFRAVLRGAGAESVEAERILIGAAGGVVVFPAGVKLTENQLPVVPALFFVPVHRDAAPEILHGDDVVARDGHVDDVAVARARFVDGIREDLKERMGAAVQPVRAENHARAFAHAIRALEGLDALIVILRRFFAFDFLGHGNAPFFRVVPVCIS